MIVNEEFIKKLRSVFDLNIYEVKILTSLLSKGVAAAGELSEISDVPRSRTYDVLESLERRGFVIMKLGKPIKYIAVKPEEIFTRVKKEIEGKSREQIKILENVEKTDVLKDLQLLFTQGIKNIDPSEISGALKGRSNIYSKLSSMFENAKKSVTLVTTSAGLLRKAEALKGLFKKLNERGVKVRILVNQLNNETKQVAEQLNKFAKIKENNKINARFCIVDDKEVLFMVHDDAKIHENYDTGIWIDSPFFASALENLFDSHWEKPS